MEQKLYKQLETAGGFVVYATAALLHFIYNLTGKSILGALFGSVNESVWEHLKIFALAYIFWAIIELLWSKPPLRKFVWSKALGVYSLCISIAVFYYIYTPIIGRSTMIVNLLSSFIFSLLSHWISYKVTTIKENRGQNFYTGVMMIFLAIIMILSFTYYPPKTPLFKDPVTGTYGILSESDRTGQNTY